MDHSLRGPALNRLLLHSHLMSQVVHGRSSLILVFINESIEGRDRMRLFGLPLWRLPPRETSACFFPQISSPASPPPPPVAMVAGDEWEGGPDVLLVHSFRVVSLLG